MKGFWVFRCKNCGTWGVKEVRIKLGSYHCKYCNSKFLVKKKTNLDFNLNNYGPFDHPKKATVVCQEFNKNRNI